MIWGPRQRILTVIRRVRQWWKAVSVKQQKKAKETTGRQSTSSVRRLIVKRLVKLNKVKGDEIIIIQNRCRKHLRLLTFSNEMVMTLV